MIDRPVGRAKGLSLFVARGQVSGPNAVRVSTRINSICSAYSLNLLQLYGTSSWRVLLALDWCFRLWNKWRKVGWPHNGSLWTHIGFQNMTFWKLRMGRFNIQEKMPSGFYYSIIPIVLLYHFNRKTLRNTNLSTSSSWTRGHVRNKLYISKKANKLFVDLCSLCQTKRSLVKKGMVTAYIFKKFRHSKISRRCASTIYFKRRL